MTTTTVDLAELDLLSGDFWAGDPLPALARLRSEAPVLRSRQSDSVAVSTHALVREVSTNTQVYSNTGGNVPLAPVLDNMICLDDPQHTERRRLVNRGFTPRQVRRLTDAVSDSCHQLIDQFCERGTADLVAELASPLPMAMVGSLLGAPAPHWPELLRWSDELMESLAGRSTTPDAQRRAVDAYMGFDRFARALLDDRRACPRDDLVSALVEGSARIGLGDDTLVHELLLLLIGGDETSRHAMSGGIAQLLRQPDDWNAFKRDRNLLPTLVEEVLRWTSPVKMMQRVTIAPATLGGIDLRVGDKLLLLYPSANRDIAAFDEPDTFDIRRTPNHHVAFGFGTHFCLGASLARLEISIVMDAIASRLPDVRLDSVAPAVRPAYFVTGAESLPVTFSPTTSGTR